MKENVKDAFTPPKQQKGMFIIMAGFVGTRCMVCNEKFKIGDDIVVCPECGTPYHRDCYKQAGNCVNTALHESGREWKPVFDVGDDASAYEEIKCRICGNVNPPMTLFCESCGHPLSYLETHNENLREKAKEQDPFISLSNKNPDAYNKNEYAGLNFNPNNINFSDKLCGYSPDEDFDGVKLSELGDFVNTNTHYYLPVFKRIKDIGRPFSWNFIAALFPELYFANRKMPLAAFAFVLIRYIICIPFYIEFFKITGGNSTFEKFASSFNVTGSAFQTLKAIVYIASYSLMFFCGRHANTMYYKKAVSKIKDIKAAAAELKLSKDLISSLIQKKGGTSGLWLALFVCIDLLPYLFFSFFNSLSMMGF